MNYQSILQTSIAAISSQEFSQYDELSNFVNTVIALAVLENTLEKYIASSSDNIGNLLETANNYAELLKTEIELFKKKYTSYKQLFNKIIEYNLKSLFALTQLQVSEICIIYSNRLEKKEFSPIEFSEYMYNVSGLSLEDHERLRNSHYNVIVPVVDAIKIKYNIDYSDVDINLSDGLIGRCFILSVSGISAIRLYFDIYTIDMSTKRSEFYRVKILNQNEIEIILK